MAYDFPTNPANGQEYVSGNMLYTWNGYAWRVGGSITGPPSDFVLVSGDTMTGHLTLNADPVDALHAATKQYADSLGGVPPVSGTDGQALVSFGGAAIWGAPIEGGNY